MKKPLNTNFFSGLLAALLTLSGAQAQSLKIFTENKQGGTVIYATNLELCPVSVQMRFDLQNMAFSEGAQTIFVVPAKGEKYKIGEITAIGNGRANFRYEYKTALGDVTRTSYEEAYLYDLPYPKGKSFAVVQGYNGSFSHQNENALDFNLPEGTEIAAAREGTVIQVVQHNTGNCQQPECKKSNNYITIQHPDGTFAHYAHIRLNGSLVRPGDAVKKGDVIGYSGNVGYSAGPHLHFVCFLPGFDNWKTIPTKFKTDGGEKAISLQEKTVYLKNY